MMKEVTSPFTGGKVIRKIDNLEYTYRGVVINAPTVYYLCVDTNEEFTDGELDEFNLEVIHNEFRIKEGIPLVHEIKGIRAKYGLSAAKMSRILGFGINTYSNYEKGEMPSVANGRIIAMCANPTYFKDYVVSLSNLDADEKMKTLSLVNKCIEEVKPDVVQYRCFEKDLYNWERANIYSGYSELSVPKAKEMVYYFSSLLKPFTTKLNKLLFYADFLFFQKYKKSITGMNYIAIQKGPVPNKFDTLYDQARHIDKVLVKFDANVMGCRFEGKESHSFNRDLFSDEELEVIKMVGDRFTYTKTNDMVELSHLEPAWLDNIEEMSLIPYSYALTLMGIE